MRTSNARSWALAVTGSIAVLSVGIVTINTLVGPPTASSASADAPRIGVESLRGTGGPASRDFTRTDPSPSVAPERILDVPAPSSSPASTHKPVAGLTQAETDNAVAVVNAAAAMNLPRRAALVAITTALQESHLRNLANSKVPASLTIAHQGVESNFDSVGVFQQRPSQGWGAVAQLMNPKAAAGLFYNRLVKVPNWQTLSVGDAAQAVQRSAFPDAYDKQQPQAQRIVDALA